MNSEIILDRETLYQGRVIRLEKRKVMLSNGQTSIREVLLHPGAVVVLARLPDGQFVLVKQYRSAIENELVEAIAGGLDSQETPDQAAYRECLEETGYTVKKLFSLGFIYPAPGTSQEKLYLYYADLHPHQSELNLDDDEILTPCHFSEAEIHHLIQDNSICDGKTLAIWHRYQCHKDHLCNSPL